MGTVNQPRRTDLPQTLRYRGGAIGLIEFEHTLRLKRHRRRFLDKTVSERYIAVTAQYSKLTKMYKLTRRIDGTVTASELTDREERMRDWMTAVDPVLLFDQRDLASSGTYYVRVRTKLHRRFKLLFVPADIETDWAESRRFRIARSGGA